jgi:hypothetical protein
MNSMNSDPRVAMSVYQCKSNPTPDGLRISAEPPRSGWRALLGQ